MATILPAIDFRRTVQQAARYPFLWQARDLSMNAASGQVGTYSATAGTGTKDSFGVTNHQTTYSQPPWSYNSLPVEIGFTPRSSTMLSWPLGSLIPQAMCGVVEFVENSNLLTYGAGVCDLSDGTGTGARLYLAVTESGTKTYELVYTDGATTRRSTMADDGGIANTYKVRLRWQLSSAGVARLWQTNLTAGNPEATASTPAATALPAAWSGTTLWLNRVNAAGWGTNIQLNCVVMMGNQSAATLLAAIA